MTTQTHLPIGSVTKSFTALALGMLCDEGKLDWDKAVREYIPWLKLADSEAEKNVTARDLMCHRSGLAKYDAHALFCTKDDRRAMVEEIDDHSRGYVFTGADYMQTEYLPLRGVAPAGGIVSNAADMEKYLKFQLGDGSWNGKTLVSAAQLEMMHTPQMDGSPYFWQLPEISEAKYGLGWFTDIYRGVPMVSHGGNTLGFSSLVTLLPEQNFGIALLTNGNSNFLAYPLTYSILDAVLGFEDNGWNEKFQATIGGIFAAMAEGQKAMAAMQIQGTSVSHPMEEYTGTFTHPAFGTLILQENGGQLAGTLNGFGAMMMHFHYDFFNLMLPTMGLSLPAQFGYGMDGKISFLDVTFEPTPGVAPVRFLKS